MRVVLALCAASLLMMSGCTSATPPAADAAPPQPRPPVTNHAEPPHPSQGAVPTSSGGSPGPAGAGHPRESRRKDESQQAAAWHKSLPSGLIHHHVESTMELAKASQVTVTVDGPNATAPAQAAGTVTDTLQVSPRMVVELTQPDNPDGFKIDPADTQAPKLIASDGSTTWSGTVTPQHLGQLKLHISAFVLYEDDPKNELSYATYDSPVTVHSVTVKHESKSAWEWVQEHPAQTLAYVLPGGAGAAILGKLIDLWRKRRRKGTEPATS